MILRHRYLLSCQNFGSNSTYRTHHQGLEGFFSSCSSSTTTSSRSGHLKRVIMPYMPRSAKDLAEYLARNIIYHKRGDVIAVEKPYGVSTLGYIQKGHGVFGYSREDYEQRESSEYNARKDDSPTIEDAIPYLKEYVQEPGLNICMGLKRWVSGPIILPCNPVAYKRIIYSSYLGSSIAHTTEYAQAQHMFKALAICVSSPALNKGTVTGYVTFQKTANASEYIFMEGTIRKRARKMNFAAQGEISYEVLAVKNEISLVDLQFSKFTKHFPRVFLSHLGTPVIGDWIYTRRLIDVDGKPILVEPKNMPRNGKNYEPKNFLQSIGLDKLRDLRMNPVNEPLLFLTVYQTILPFWGDSKTAKAKTELRLTIPPPEHFLAMTDLLNFTSPVRQRMDSLYADEQNSMESDEEKLNAKTEVNKVRKKNVEKKRRHASPSVIVGNFKSFNV